ncbi:hypothetical protein N2152v2_000622, partial [Parachlorella kessleri]
MSDGRRRSRGATSRNVQAFEALLAPDSGDEAQPGSARRRRSNGGRSGGRARPIQLRDEPGLISNSCHGAQQGSHDASSLRQLQDMFGGVLPPDVIKDVFQACDESAEAATEALLAMAGGGTSLQREAGSGPAATAVAGQREAAAVPPAAGAGDLEGWAWRQGRGWLHVVFDSPCYWHWLPGEVKEAVLGLLSVRDLARAAGACAELAEHVRRRRRRLRCVALPEGISMRAVRGAVSAFSHAPALSLTRWAPHLRFPNQCEDLLEAVARGEADRISGVPIRHVDLSRCGGLTDGDVGTLCATLRHLDSLDLSRCGQITDDCLAALARYTSDPFPAATSAPASWQGAGGADGHAGEGEGWGDVPAVDDVRDDAGGDAELALALALSRADLGARGPASRDSPEIPKDSKIPPTDSSGSFLLHPGPASPNSAVKQLVAAREAAQAEARLAAEASKGGGLRQLRLRETAVTSRGIKALLQGGGAACKSLQVLDVSGCRGVGPEGFDLGSK